MTLTLTKPLIIFDLETTGVDVENDRIVSLALHRSDGAARELRFNPGRPIPPEATAVHGITDADVAACPSFGSVAQGVLLWFHGHDVAGFNVRHFDVPLLSAEFRRAGITWPTPDVAIVDAFRIYNRKEPRTLGAAMRHYCGREHDDAHNATADVQACLDVIMEQAKRYDASTVAELAALEKDADWLDQDGRIKWQGDVAVIGFGKWQGRPLSQVDRSYLQWMLGQDFGAEVKAIISHAMLGSFPTRGVVP